MPISTGKTKVSSPGLAWRKVRVRHHERKQHQDGADHGTFAHARLLPAAASAGPVGDARPPS